MNKLYAVTINGKMFFLSGNIPPYLYESLDKIAQSYYHENLNYDDDTYCHQFIKHIYEKYNLSLEILKVNHVFRIK